MKGTPYGFSMVKYQFGCNSRDRTVTFNILEQVIQESVNKCGYVSQIQNRNQSRSTIEDKLMEAVKLFKAMEKRPFHLGNCYNLLKHQPKWIEKVNQLVAAKLQTKSRRPPPIVHPGPLLLLMRGRMLFQRLLLTRPEGP